LLNASRRPRDNPAMPHDFHRHDVIVIGGGRSGALASHWLAAERPAMGEPDAFARRRLAPRVNALRAAQGWNGRAGRTEVEMSRHGWRPERSQARRGRHPQEQM
jgi:hypothetical protein